MQSQRCARHKHPYNKVASLDANSCSLHNEHCSAGSFEWVKNRWLHVVPVACGIFPSCFAPDCFSNSLLVCLTEQEQSSEWSSINTCCCHYVVLYFRCRNLAHGTCQLRCQHLGKLVIRMLLIKYLMTFVRN